MKKVLEDRIYTYSNYMKEKYGRKVFRVGLSIGKICPHRLKTGGCIFCNPETFTGEYQAEGLSIPKQLDKIIPRIKHSCGNVGLLAYFQDETSTAGSIDFLKEKYQQALNHPEILGLVVSTRSDYITPKVLDLLKSFKVNVTVELGLQSIHNKSLDLLNRGHDFKSVDEAIKLCGEAGLEVGVHLIMGIPGENLLDMIETINYVSNNRYIKQVKFHNLVVYEDTKLSEMVNMQNWGIFSIDDYIPILAESLSYLRKDIVVARLFTSNIRQSQIAIGNYDGNKTKWMARLRNYMNDHDIYQGDKFRV